MNHKLLLYIYNMIILLNFTLINIKVFFNMIYDRLVYSIIYIKLFLVRYIYVQELCITHAINLF